MGRKKTEGEFRQVGFRMPIAHYEVLAAYAEMRGIDLSAMLNYVLSEHIDDWRDQLQRRRAPSMFDGADGPAPNARDREAAVLAAMPEGSREQIVALADEYLAAPTPEDRAAFRERVLAMPGGRRLFEDAARFSMYRREANQEREFGYGGEEAEQ